MACSISTAFNATCPLWRIVGFWRGRAVLPLFSATYSRMDCRGTCAAGRFGDSLVLVGHGRPCLLSVPGAASNHRPFGGGRRILLGDGYVVPPTIPDQHLHHIGDRAVLLLRGGA